MDWLVGKEAGKWGGRNLDRGIRWRNYTELFDPISIQHENDVDHYILGNPLVENSQKRTRSRRGIRR